MSYREMTDEEIRRACPRTWTEGWSSEDFDRVRRVAKSKDLDVVSCIRKLVRDEDHRLKGIN